jgi:hypothetical protein
MTLRVPVLAALTAFFSSFALNAAAFCGFYVGKADASLFNDASRVIYVRDGHRSVITMVNDYRGPLSEFALVVPVPTVLGKGDVKIVDKAVVDRVDAYSAPRLAEYFDPDPCQIRYPAAMAQSGGLARREAEVKAKRDSALGVRIEAQYTVGEYDILILSARQSDGLETWLRENKYHMPQGASAALKPYIKQNMKFFVARVNLGEQAKAGHAYLRPLQFAFESEKFMLPIRLGMINARGTQDLVVYVLTRNGRVETTNYRTLKLPANMDIPVFVRSDFATFYKALFGEQAKREAHRVVFTEYFWDMSWCDPCAADPLSGDELKAAGVSWLQDAAIGVPGQPGTMQPRQRRAPIVSGQRPVMLTRLHVRYTSETFPEDLQFQETGDRQNFQARYVLRHAWKGAPDACAQAQNYYEQVARRQDREAQSAANLTGWSIDVVRNRMGIDQISAVDTPEQRAPWWSVLRGVAR